jgi:anhydro-N-acetylmuramic acid kinase
MATAVNTPVSADLLVIGIMSGTSLDGADAVAARIEGDHVEILGHAHRAYDTGLRASLMRLQAPSADELDLASIVAQQLARHYADLSGRLLAEQGIAKSAVRAIAVHGQTIRHRPAAGYTLQLNAPALLAELTGIDVIADFRSRDVAAGGHGAPLVPAFHAAVFGDAKEHRAALNLGGMANLTDLPAGVGDAGALLRGWDTGPGNVFLDAWFGLHHPGHADGFDRDGAYASQGQVDAALLELLLDDPWFKLPPPKSTGRDQFNAHWLEQRLQQRAGLDPVAVQATLAELTATTVVEMLALEIRDAKRLIVCGGGVNNLDLMSRLARLAAARLGPHVVVESSKPYGVLPEHVEATAFAWLGVRFLRREPGNRTSVTGARGERVLGALYPA